MDSWADLATDLAVFIAGQPGGASPEMNPEQKAALNRYQELAQQACRDTPRAPGQSALSWGQDVHTTFNNLVKAENQVNPKMFPETAYLNQEVVRGRPLTSSLPDGVFGNNPMQPEFFVDLKTGLNLIQPKWVARLTGNLPPGYTDIPVWRLSC